MTNRCDKTINATKPYPGLLWIQWNNGFAVASAERWSPVGSDWVLRGFAARVRQRIRLRTAARMQRVFLPTWEIRRNAGQTTPWAR